MHEFRPYYRVQIDLAEVKPSGPNGERYIFTLIDVATRYMFLRATATRDAADLAFLMLTIFMEMGVIPAVVQSDNEFTSLAFEEMCGLLGSSQAFATALRPQSQGIVERSHRTIREQLAILVEVYTRGNPRQWVKYLPFVEARLRNKSLAGTGGTPFKAIHGFFGSSALSTALGAIEEIPLDLVYGDWLRSIVSESRTLMATLQDHWIAAADDRAQSQTAKIPDFVVGELVLIARAFYERGQGVILRQCAGPFTVARALSNHLVILTDPLTNEPYLGGRPQSTARLVRFNFPADYAIPEHQEPASVDLLSELRIGSFVAVEPK